MFLQSCALFAVLSVVSGGILSSGVLDNHGVYKIENKHDHGVLTMSTADADSTKVYLQTDKDSASQKWRAKQPALSKSYEFKPTSNEAEALTADGSSLKVHGMVTTSDGKYWHVRDVGEGAFELKNYLTSNCLTSQGLGSSVTTAPCDNSVQQQWKLKEL